MRRRTKVINQPQPARRKRRKLIPVDPKHVRVRVSILSDGHEPNEVIVQINSFHGPRCFTLDRQIILDDSTLRVGGPLARRARFSLIDIPHQRTRQLAWVDVRELVPDPPTLPDQ